jgi:uncharacterized phage protein (TIGR01671 family)
MREIIFKAKRTDNSQWVEGSLLETKGILQISVFDHELYKKESEGGWDIFDFNTFVTVDSETVCQYTGLTDKNGNKIWEGDINQDLGYVFWNKDFAAFQWCYLNGDIMDFEDEQEWCIVIGNIFDNPELLSK